MRIALTGGIGSGKNIVADIFHELGCYTIDLDAISRTIYKKGTSAYNQILDAFSNDNILDSHGAIDRSVLRKIVFADHTKRVQLEGIAHKEIFLEEERVVRDIKSKDGKSIIITHAALMIETSAYKRYDYTILIYTDRETQIDRVVGRDNLSIDEVNNILDIQLPYSEKVRYADMIIDNNQDKIALRHEVERVYNLIQHLIYGAKHNH